MMVMGCSDRTSFDPSTPPQLAPLHTRKCWAQRHLLSELDNETPWKSRSKWGFLSCTTDANRNRPLFFFFPHVCVCVSATLFGFMLSVFLEVTFLRKSLQATHIAQPCRPHYICVLCVCLRTFRVDVYVHAPPLSCLCATLAKKPFLRFISSCLSICQMFAALYLAFTSLRLKLAPPPWS